MSTESISAPADPEWIRQQIRADDEVKFNQRVARVQRVKVHRIIPHLWFDVASTECMDLFRDGHFYGCICLSQSVAEGLAKFVLETHRVKIGKQKRPIELCEKPATGRRLIDVLKNLKSGLYNGQPWSVLSEKCLKAFDCIEGGDREDFHHLNKRIITDFAKLEERAEQCVTALYDIESELFGFEITDGAITPYQREYWPDAGKKFAKVHLRAY
jgi:hypothetical protein